MVKLLDLDLKIVTLIVVIEVGRACFSIVASKKITILRIKTKSKSLQSMFKTFISPKMNKIRKTISNLLRLILLNF